MRCLGPGTSGIAACLLLLVTLDKSFSQSISTAQTAEDNASLDISATAFPSSPAVSPSAVVSEEIRTQTFLSRPQQTSLCLDILEAPDPNDSSVDETAYIFTSPYWTLFPPRGFSRPDPATTEWGPHIFDISGNLVWHAPLGWVQYRAWPFTVCDYLGERGTHLCINDGVIDPRGGYSNGTTRFFNSSYVEVGQLGGTAGLNGPDGHELTMLDGGQSLLHDAYQPLPADLSGFNGLSMGYFFAGCFQERDVRTHDAVFTWCSSDHVPLDESLAALVSGVLDFSVGTEEPIPAGSAEKPYDYFHINSVDKDANGDYYVSGKTTGTIYKVAGLHSDARPGDIIWRLGGKFNSFTMVGEAHFAGQHHVRLLSVSEKTTVLSMFDNDGAGESNLTTSGKVLEIDNTTMTARALETYLPPNGYHVRIQGTTQRLTNGNMFMGWGPNNILTEHAPGMPGKMLWHAIFGSGLDLEGYRSYKLPWKGYPLEPPDVFAYALHCEAPVTVYMSWNGATEYRSWNILVAASGLGEARQTATALRDGFETVAKLPAQSGRIPAFVYVEALDDGGQVLGTSKRVEVWVPSDGVKAVHSCDFERCAPTLNTYDAKDSQAQLCRLA